MGVIINTDGGGGAGGGIRYNAQTDMIQVKVNGQWVDTPYKAYGTFDGTLYDNGVQAVPWDNTGYYGNSTSTYKSGATLSQGSFTFPVASVNNAFAVIITDDKIDCTGFTTLKATINGTTYSLNISQYISEPAYIAVFEYCETNQWSLYISLNRTKEYFDANRITGTTWGQLPTGAFSSPIPPITKVWLE